MGGGHISAAQVQEMLGLADKSAQRRLFAALLAQEGITGLRNNNAVVVTGLANKVGAFGARFMPRGLSRRIVRIIQG